jgi:hypothetical protein
MLKERFYNEKKFTLSLNKPRGIYFLTIRSNMNAMAVVKLVLE